MMFVFVCVCVRAVPKDGLKSQVVFDEIRMTYIKELGKAIVKREENASQNWQRFYQLTKLLDSMQEVRETLIQDILYTACFTLSSLMIGFATYYRLRISCVYSILKVASYHVFLNSSQPTVSFIQYLVVQEHQYLGVQLSSLLISVMA